ncbi:hypothetical protein AOLI_G00280950 [Acnodon oligacanthus]
MGQAEALESLSPPLNTGHQPSEHTASLSEWTWPFELGVLREQLRESLAEQVYCGFDSECQLVVRVSSSGQVQCRGRGLPEYGWETEALQLRERERERERHRGEERTEEPADPGASWHLSGSRRLLEKVRGERVE